MTEILAQILDLPMSNNGFCNTISHQMACVNTEFYHINIKKNYNAYLKRSKEIQYITSRLLYFEQLKINYKYCRISDEDLTIFGEELAYFLPNNISEDIALTLYCFNTYYDVYWNENDNITSFTKDYVKMFYLKENDFHKDFIFDFTLDLWKKIKKNIALDSSVTIEQFIFSLSFSFKISFHLYEKKSIVAGIFISMRWNQNMVKGSEFNEGRKSSRKLLKYTTKDMFIRDYNILITTQPTMPELLRLHNNAFESNEEHEYFKIFMFNNFTYYFVQELIFDIIQNSSIKKNKRINRWIHGFLSGLVY